MNMLPEWFQNLDTTQQNDLVKTHIGNTIAQIIHQAMHSKLGNPQLEIEKIQNSQVVQNLTPEAKNKVLEMCSKALEIIKML